MTISPPLMTGPMMSDVVTWKWDRRRNRWTAILRDDTELRAQMERRGRMTYWRAEIWSDEVMRLPDDFKHPDAAQKAAFDHYMEHRGAIPQHYAPEEDT